MTIRPHGHEFQPLDLKEWLVHSQKNLVTHSCNQSKTFDSGGGQIPHVKLSFVGRYWRHKYKVSVAIEWKFKCN
jgi:hypothetical protein